MPLYQYECLSGCGRFEASRKYEEADKVKCPGCKGEVKRVFSPFSFSFGWRLTPDSHDAVKRETRQGGRDKIERNV